MRQIGICGNVMDDDPRKYMAKNRERWNELVGHHVNNSTYDLESLKKGNSCLNQLELDLLGSLKDKKILHLQCHFGMDSLSLLYEGADEVVGVDYSKEAITKASELATELKLNARFIHSNVLTLDDVFDEFGSFDIVYTSYGTVVWLPDLVSWANVISKYLKPNGKFLIVDAHPFSHIFDDENAEATLDPVFRYFHSEIPDYYNVEGSYATSAVLEHTEEYIWVHPVSDIINAILSNGLIVEQFNEYPKINWRMFPFLQRRDDGWYYFPEDWTKTIIPLCFALMARKPYNTV